jgi:Uma2 family endonuclease
MSVSLKTPLVLVTDDDLVRVSEENPGYQFERERDGSVTVSPTSTNGAAKDGEAFAQLYAYAKKFGGKAFGSSAGFKLDGERIVKSPDASWVSRARIDALTAAERRVFYPLSPDVAIEVCSPSDSFETIVEKGAQYIQYGSTYAVAIDPQTRQVVEFGDPPAGLSLDFDAIIDA